MVQSCAGDPEYLCLWGLLFSLRMSFTSPSLPPNSLTPSSAKAHHYKHPAWALGNMEATAVTHHVLAAHTAASGTDPLP